jgi:hypothetical protein
MIGEYLPDHDEIGLTSTRNYKALVATAVKV